MKQNKLWKNQIVVVLEDGTKQTFVVNVKKIRNLTKQMNNMKDLVDFKNYQIIALQKKVFELEQKSSTLETYIFELTDKDCPEEYKNIVKNELLKTD